MGVSVFKVPIQVHAGCEWHAGIQRRYKAMHSNACDTTGSSAILTDVVTRVIVRLLRCVNASQNNKKPNCKNFQWQERLSRLACFPF